MNEKGFNRRPLDLPTIMRIRNPGMGRERLWFLGREESGGYLLEGEDGSMLVGGRMSRIIPDVLQQFKEFGDNRLKNLSIFLEPRRLQSCSRAICFRPS